MDLNQSNIPQKNNQKKKFFIMFLILINVIIILALLYTQTVITLFSQRFFSRTSHIHNATTPQIHISPYKYPENVAKSHIQTFLTQVLKPEDLPQNLTVIQKLDNAGTPEDTDYTFGSQWEAQGQTFHASFHFDQNTPNPRDVSILTTFPLNTAQLPELLRKYFLNVPSQLQCKTISQGIQGCQSFQNRGSTHKEFFAMSAKTSSVSASVIFSCEIPSGSSWEKRKSCYDQFANSGL